MAASLRNLLDMCSEFTRGQDFIVDIASDKCKVKKSRKEKSSNKVSQEEKEYAEYIGYNCSDNSVHHLEEADDKDTVHPMDHQRSFYGNNGNRFRLSNRVGVGRGRILHADNSDFLPMGALCLDDKPTRQELNDHVIGKQLREMGIGVSNNDIEAEFEKKFRTKSGSPMLDNNSSSSGQSQKEEAMCKRKRETQKIYVPPHLRSNTHQETPSASSVRDFDNKNVEIDEDSRQPVQISALRPRPVYEISDEDYVDAENFINSDVSNSENEELQQSVDIVNVTKKNDGVEELGSSLIQFKIVSNERSKIKSVGRNALINGLLNRNTDSVKICERNSDSNSVGNDRSSECGAGIGSRNDSEGFECSDRDTSHKNLDNTRYEDGHHTTASTSKNNFKDINIASSESSSSNSIPYDAEQPIYFTAPVSGKILRVNPTKSYMDIIPKSHKPLKMTLGDFVDENKLPKSSRSTPTDLESDLNPLAKEFSPKSSTSTCSRSDFDNFFLDVKEFPPL